MANQARGWLTISIDLEMEIELRARREQRNLDLAARRLLTLLDEHGLSATWAVADPAHSAATEMILASRGKHEVAILGDRTWVGSGAGRTRFARELMRRVEGSRAAGIAISTLALQDTQLDEHLDLLVKHRISVLRDCASASRQNPLARKSQWKRFGVWRPAIDCQLPSNRRWWQGGATLAVRRALQRGAAAGAVTHVLIDGSRLLDGGESGLAPVVHLLREAARRGARGQLAATTLSKLSARFTSRRPVVRARSILKPAA